jgi:hypothetical protein
VSPNGDGTLLPNECVDGKRFPDELEVVTFRHVGFDGDETQPENLVIDGTPWQLEEPLDVSDAVRRLEAVTYDGQALFGNRGKAVHVDDTAHGVDESLLIVEPADIELCLNDEYKPRAHFTQASRSYDLPISDELVGPALRARPPGCYTFSQLGFDEPSRVFLALSLSLPVDVWHYKLVAGMLMF